MIAPAVALAIALAAGGRPTLSGPELTHLTADGRVKIHYTLEGVDQLPDELDEDPKNGVLDTIDHVEEGARRMLDTFVVEDGWPAPPPDGGIGGDDRLDIYMKDIPANGYAYDEGYIEIAPHRKVEYSREAFASIVGHEVHHILEFTAGGGFVPSWLLEATATWAQYTVFHGDDQVRLAEGFLWYLRLLHPDYALTHAGAGDLHEYAGLIWLKYVVDRGGGARTLALELYRAISTAGSWTRGHDAFAAAHLPGLSSFLGMVADHAVWNVFACAGDDGLHYDRGRSGCALGGRVASLPAVAPGSASFTDIGALGTGYVALAPDCNTGDVEITVEPSGKMRLQVVAVAAGKASTVTIADGDVDRPMTVTVPSWGHLKQVMVLGTNLGDLRASYKVTTKVTGTYAAPATLPAIVSLAIDPTSLMLEDGDETTARVTATYGTCADGRDVSKEVAWRSSDPKVARVSAGVIEAVGPGTAEIDASIGEIVSGRITVTVTAAPSPGGCSVGGRGRSALWLLALALVAMRRVHRTF